MSKKFAPMIALLYLFTFILFTFITTYVDTHYVHFTFGLRNYPLGYYVILISVPISIITYLINSNKKFCAFEKSIYTFTNFFIIVLIILFLNFRPEFPHMSLFGSLLASNIINACTIFIHECDINTEFINSDSINERVKIERIKLEYETWCRLFTTALVASVAFGYTMYASFQGIAEMVTPDGGSRVMIIQSLIVEFVFICFLASILFMEIIKKIVYIENLLIEIKKIPKYKYIETNISKKFSQ